MKIETPHTWTAASLSLLGTMTDASLAEKLGVSKLSIGAKRRELRIPPAKRISHRRIHWTPEMDALLGTEIDLAIARKLRINATSVGIRRKQLKIASWKDLNQNHR